jgi:predicted alpha/beta-hydrolase family hydrolase
VAAVKHKLGFLSPILTLIAADVALRAGHKVVRQAVEHGLLRDGRQQGPPDRGNSVKETVVATAIAEVARRSVPGAIVVGGVFLAKFLHSRRAEARARRFSRPRRAEPPARRPPGHRPSATR